MYGKTKAGSGLPVLVEDTGALILSRGGKYREATEDGRVFAVANQAAVTTTAGLAATYTGLALCNPVGSGKNFALLGFGYVNTKAVPTVATVVGIMTGGGVGAATSVIAGRNRLSGGPSSVAYVDSAVVFTEAPVLEQVFSTFQFSASNEAIGPSVNWIDLEGSVIVTPGYHVSAYNQEINATTFIYSFLWEEYTP